MYHIDKPVKYHQKVFHLSVQVAALAKLLKDDEIELTCRQRGHTWRNRHPVNTSSFIMVISNNDNKRKWL